MSRIVVITPTLGESPWLDEAVASAAALPVVCRHVLVCPQARLDALRRRFPHATVVAETGCGMYTAINAGLATQPDDWDAFTYLNDDDLLLPRFDVVAAQIARLPGPGMAYGGVRLIDAKGNRLGGIPISRFPVHNRALYAARLEPVYQHGTAITRAAWSRIGPFNATLKYCGDSDYLARLCLNGVPAQFVGGEVAAFRLRPGQLTKQREAMTSERRRVDEALGLRRGVGLIPRGWARLCFRLANGRIYLERLRRQGWKRFDDVLTESVHE